MRAFGDIQAAIMELVRGFGTVGVSTPDDLDDRLPFIRVSRIGGNDNRFTDTAVVDVEVFTSTYAGVKLADDIRNQLLNFPHRTNAGILDRITTDISPREIPWTDGSTVRRFAATYRVRARR